jgi:hypothetical protein
MPSATDNADEPKAAGAALLREEAAEMRLAATLAERYCPAELLAACDSLVTWLCEEAERRARQADRLDEQAERT